MIKAILFDCFGVVITDALDVVRTDLRLQGKHAEAQQIDDIVIANNRGFIEADESNERIAEVLGITVGDLRKQVDDRETKDHNVLDYILVLRKSYKIAMLSNIAGSSLASRFTGDELERYFDIVVASGDIGYAKPEPEAYQITAERLGVRTDECVFTDDRELFCEAARATGMQSIVYTSFTQFQADLEPLLAQEPADA